MRLRLVLAVFLLAAAIRATAADCTGIAADGIRLSTNPFTPAPNVPFTIDYVRNNPVPTNPTVAIVSIASSIRVELTHNAAGATESCIAGTLNVPGLSAREIFIDWYERASPGAPAVLRFSHLFQIATPAPSITGPDAIQLNQSRSFNVHIGARQQTDVIVSVSSSHPSRLSVPATITVPAGQLFASGNAQASSEEGPVEVTARLPPALSTAVATWSTTVVDWTPCAGMSPGPVSTLRLTLVPTPTPPGVPVQFRYETFSPFNPIFTSVTFVGNRITVTYRLLAGPSCISFAKNLGPLTSGTYEVWQSTVVGFLSPQPPPSLIHTFIVGPAALTFTPPTLSGRVGTPLIATIHLGAAVTTDTIVTLSSTNTAVATVPPTVTIPAGQTTVTFPITLLASGNSTISATLSASLGGTVATAVVAAADPNPDVPTLSSLALLLLAIALAAVAALFVK